MNEAIKSLEATPYHLLNEQRLEKRGIARSPRLAVLLPEKHTQRIQVYGVKAGEREMSIVGGGDREHLDKTEIVEISLGKTPAMLVKASPYSTL